MNYPTAHPVFMSPATFYPKSNQSRRKKLHFWFLTEIQSLLTEKFRKLGRRVKCRRDRLAKLCFTGKFEWSRLFKCSSYVEDKKVREKKIKKITQVNVNFLFLFFRNARVVSRPIWEFHPVLSISIFNDFFFPSNNSSNWRHICRSIPRPLLTAGQNIKHAAEKIDIVALKTAEISRREKKKK